VHSLATGCFYRLFFQNQMTNTFGDAPVGTCMKATSSAVPLVATDVHRTYTLGGHQLPVLQGVNLEVAAGEKVFLCGQSGAGKTTLLYVLGGLEKPTSGDVLVHGQSLYHGAAKARAKMRNQVMGFVFQHYFLLPELTALENVLLPSMIGGKRAEGRARELLDRVGLTPRIDHLPTELSGGEQQRVAIARALINDPGILYADEPTGNLDASTGTGVMDMLISVVNESQKTLVVVTHDQQMAKRGDRRLILKQGVLEES
jgi:predicted ABC-type transport system involved in lysophospholipase L1 biosynthesis ATPase subunit